MFYVHTEQCAYQTSLFGTPKKLRAFVLACYFGNHMSFFFFLSVAFRLFASTDGVAQCRVACAAALLPGAGSLWRVCRALALL